VPLGNGPGTTMGGGCYRHFIENTFGYLVPVSAAEWQDPTHFCTLHGKQRHSPPPGKDRNYRKLFSSTSLWVEGGGGVYFPGYKSFLIEGKFNPGEHCSYSFLFCPSVIFLSSPFPPSTTAYCTSAEVSSTVFNLVTSYPSYFPVLRSRIIFLRLRLRVKILMRLRLRLRLRLLPYCKARQNF
jgi:hypothetical protein